MDRLLRSLQAALGTLRVCLIEFRIALTSADRALDEIDPPPQIGQPGGSGGAAYP